MSENPKWHPPVQVHGAQFQSVEQAAHQALTRRQSERDQANRGVFDYSMSALHGPEDWERERRGRMAIDRAKARGLHKGGSNFTHEDMMSGH